MTAKRCVIGVPFFIFRKGEIYMQKLTAEELQDLRKLERWCYDTMNYARISPTLLTKLLNGYNPKQDN
ncbi:hypothetical protein [Bacillus sp. NPDC093026]|uniref:hypothetical protein n=1 Tax=Bacillus sp. NPDC093026 TaxID=3363948 RepID=UPI0038250738